MTDCHCLVISKGRDCSHACSVLEVVHRTQNCLCNFCAVVCSALSARAVHEHSAGTVVAPSCLTLTIARGLCSWVGTIRVAVSIAMIGVHALAPVGGHIDVVEGGGGGGEKAEGGSLEPAADDTTSNDGTPDTLEPADGEPPSKNGTASEAEISPEEKKGLPHIHKALDQMCKSIEKTAAVWKKHNMGGQASFFSLPW